jgi:plasmid stability protein
METVLIRRVDPAIKVRLRIQAAQHGRSMEEEAREILRIALTGNAQRPNLAESIRKHIVPLGGVELDLPRREPTRQPPSFD